MRIAQPAHYPRLSSRQTCKRSGASARKGALTANAARPAAANMLRTIFVSCSLSCRLWQTNLQQRAATRSIVQLDQAAMLFDGTPGNSEARQPVGVASLGKGSVGPSHSEDFLNR